MGQLRTSCASRNADCFDVSSPNHLGENHDKRKGFICSWGSYFLAARNPLVCIDRHNLRGELLTFLLPGIFLLGYVLVSILRRNQAPKPSAAIFMLLGVVFLATFAITIGATLRGAGFAEHPGSTLLGVLLGTAIPIYGFIAATYDGSLYALIFLSLCMPLVHLIFERRNWVFPPKGGTSEAAGAA